MFVSQDACVKKCSSFSIQQELMVIMRSAVFYVDILSTLHRRHKIYSYFLKQRKLHGFLRNLLGIQLYTTIKFADIFGGSFCRKAAFSQYKLKSKDFIFTFLAALLKWLLSPPEDHCLQRNGSKSFINQCIHSNILYLINSVASNTCPHIQLIMPTCKVSRKKMLTFWWFLSFYTFLYRSATFKARCFF